MSKLRVLSGGDGDSDPFVAVHERMILREALPHSGRLLNQVLVLAAPRARDGGLKRGAIPEAHCSAETRDETFVGQKNLFDAGIAGH